MNTTDLDLDAAWRKVLRDAYSDQLPDVLKLEDYKLTWNDWKDELLSSLDAGTYRPSEARVIEMPKDGLLVRPLALMHPRDRVVYWAIVNRIAEAVDASLPDTVFSARLRSSGGMIGQVSAWTRFQEAGRELYDKYSYAHLLSTDVTSYFEYVEIDILIDDLRTLGGIDELHVKELKAFLHGLTDNRALWGLPQGHEASAILGNFYLLPVDRALLGHDVRAIRYQDDIKVFASDRASLRVALRDINRVLRARHLNLSVHKTKFLEGPEILREFEDARKDAIQYGLDAGNAGAPAELRNLFDDAIAGKPVKARDVRFAVYRLAKLKDPHAVAWILDNLADVPYLASHLVNYLSEYIDEMPEIEQRVSEFLLDPIENVFPWAEMHLLRLLGRSKTIQPETHTVVWKVLGDRNRDVIVREHAARCFGIHAQAGDAPLLRDLSQDVDELPLRRALLVAYTEAGDRKRPDRAFLGAVERDSPELAPTCRFLRSPAVIPPP